DTLEADYHIRNGVLSTVTPFTLKGPSADIELTGTVDINHAYLDHKLHVILPVSKNLPLVGLLLGQPQIAAGVYLIDKLIGGRIARATAIDYSLKGPWDEPTITLLESEKPSG
ncbi:MAG: AsmA-like C-terminal region-containing protein, partial [Pontibacterium sp.]